MVKYEHKFKAFFVIKIDYSFLSIHEIHQCKLIIRKVELEVFKVFDINRSRFMQYNTKNTLQTYINQQNIIILNRIFSYIY